MEPVDELYLVTIEALPNPGTEEYENCGGAYVNVYVREESEAAALETAQREVAASGWTCKSIEHTGVVTREDFTEDDDGLEYFEQAIEEGVVLVFHTFPISPDEGDAVH